MKAYLYDHGLMIKSGKIIFKPGQMPKEESIWIPEKHDQFIKAVEWAKEEGLL